jgi:hypothetical protein
MNRVDTWRAIARASEGLAGHCAGDVVAVHRKRRGI